MSEHKMSEHKMSEHKSEHSENPPVEARTPAPGHDAPPTAVRSGGPMSLAGWVGALMDELSEAQTPRA